MSFFGKDNGKLILSMIYLQFKFSYILFTGGKKMAATVKKEAKPVTDPPPSKVIESTPSPP